MARVLRAVEIQLTLRLKLPRGYRLGQGMPQKIIRSIIDTGEIPEWADITFTMWIRGGRDYAERANDEPVEYLRAMSRMGLATHMEVKREDDED